MSSSAGSLQMMFVLGLSLGAIGSTSLTAVGAIDSNRTIPLNQQNSGTEIPYSNPTGSVFTPVDAATVSALNAEWQILRDNYIRLGQMVAEPELNPSSQALIRDMNHRLQVIQKQIPPAAAGLTGSDRNFVIREYRGELAGIEDQLDRTLAALQMFDPESAWHEFEAIRLPDGQRFGLE